MKTTNNNEVIQLLSGRSNVFLIKGADGGMIIIDTSVKFVRRMLMSELKRHKALDATYLILTHHHFDHAANAAYLREQLGLKTIIHKAEADYLETGKMQIPLGTNTFTKKLVNLANSIKFELSAEKCTADIKVDDRFDVPGFKGITLIHTPGHSEGSISVIIDNEIAVVGDAMVNVGLFKIMPPFADNVNDLKPSWNKLLITGCKTYLPSHGSAISRKDLEDYMVKLK